MKSSLVLTVCFILTALISSPLVSFAASPSPDHENFTIADPTFSSGSKKVILANNSEGLTSEEEEWGDFEEEFETIETISDPFESYNRFFYKFNDKLYFYLLKPVAKQYGVILPERARISVQNFFLNLYTPVRFINSGLQGDTNGAFNELSRFTINTTLGIAGFFDPAKSLFKLEMQEEDFGQTLGCFTGPGFYVNNPFQGPSSLRDSIGSIVDLFIVPSYYVLVNSPLYYTAGAKIIEVINRNSLTLGEYEELKRAALDPYIALRDGYFQYREDLIRR